MKISPVSLHIMRTKHSHTVTSIMKISPVSLHTMCTKYSHSHLNNADLTSFLAHHAHQIFTQWRHSRLFTISVLCHPLSQCKHRKFMDKQNTLDVESLRKLIPTVKFQRNLFYRFPYLPKQQCTATKQNPIYRQLWMGTRWQKKASNTQYVYIA
jgi:hypothetical protein